MCAMPAQGKIVGIEQMPVGYAGTLPQIIPLKMTVCSHARDNPSENDCVLQRSILVEHLKPRETGLAGCPDNILFVS